MIYYMYMYIIIYIHWSVQCLPVIQDIHIYTRAYPIKYIFTLENNVLIRYSKLIYIYQNNLAWYEW